MCSEHFNLIELVPSQFSYQDFNLEERDNEIAHLSMKPLRGIIPCAHFIMHGRVVPHLLGHLRYFFVIGTFSFVSDVQILFIFKVFKGSEKLQLRII